jgi:hypothetical protein
MIECPWNDSLQSGWVIFTFHREGFACSSLPICKYGPIVALQDALNDGCSGVPVQQLLQRVRFEDLVKSKLLGGFISGLRVPYGDLTLPGVHLNHHLAAISHLLRGERPATDDNLHTFGVLHL